MATRLDVQARRVALYESLKRSCVDGVLSPGTMLPTVRELGERHGVSANVVFGVIQSLTDEGILYTVPRVGAFVGRQQPETVEPYLMLVPSRRPERDDLWVQAQAGFEDRVAQLGGHSIVLTALEARVHLEHNELPPLSGVFGSSWNESLHLFKEAGVPRVLFGTQEEDGEDVDRISFDDIDGGVQATRHLWQNGHRSIAFLASHIEGDIAMFPWSVRREIGWRKALEQAGSETTGLAFHPQKVWGRESEDQLRTGREAAKQLVGRTDMTAVIVANVIAARAMFETFQDMGWPTEKWPAVVCFDAAPNAGTSIVSYLRLPWEDVGREAAQVLWERRTGRLTGEAKQRLLSMRLIPRLSCRIDWAKSSALVRSRISGTTPLHRQVAR